jgi:hypothetical protein
VPKSRLILAPRECKHLAKVPVYDAIPVPLRWSSCVPSSKIEGFSKLQLPDVALTVSQSVRIDKQGIDEVKRRSSTPVRDYEVAPW